MLSIKLTFAWINEQDDDDDDYFEMRMNISRDKARIIINSNKVF
jgi:hypothetical protein